MMDEDDEIEFTLASFKPVSSEVHLEATQIPPPENKEIIESNEEVKKVEEATDNKTDEDDCVNEEEEEEDEYEEYVNKPASPTFHFGFSQIDDRQGEVTQDVTHKEEAKPKLKKTSSVSNRVTPVKSTIDDKQFNSESPKPSAKRKLSSSSSSTHKTKRTPPTETKPIVHSIG